MHLLLRTLSLPHYLELASTIFGITHKFAREQKKVQEIRQNMTFYKIIRRDLKNGHTL
jgi:hypothetical protein